MKFRAALLGLCLAASAASADPQTAARLRDQALSDNTAWNVLESLTTEVGPRPAGSPNAARARDWGVAKFNALGFTNVHVEPFAKTAWLRGAESAEIIGPFPHKLALLGIGNSPSTPPEGLTAEVVVFKSLAELKAAPGNCCAGKIVLVNQPMTRTQDIWGYGLGVAARSAAPEAAKRGAVAYLVRSISTSTNRSPHTGAMRPPGPDVKVVPTAALGVPDADLIEHMSARGPVTVHLALQSHVVDTTAWTVSGDIAGSDPKAGVIVIGGHLDSWDPGTGAIDDASGIAITMAAAKLVATTNPRRTIRMVMWGSEETGGSGDAYLAAHKAELGNIVIAGESDLGADNIFSLQLPAGSWEKPDLKPLESLVAPLKIMAAPAPAEDGGSDIEAIHGAGVPVLALNQDASRYFDYHHTADDTLAIVDPLQLKQNVAAWTAVLETIANSDVTFRAGKKK
ncbi:MAG: peptidase family protein [Alphaproteobacteria bacterium]|nr:peptidase family protein [Alphaproteobacteria bacterium]